MTDKHEQGAGAFNLLHSQKQPFKVACVFTKMRLRKTALGWKRAAKKFKLMNTSVILEKPKSSFL
jgi:hypothetical protein